MPLFILIFVLVGRRRPGRRHRGLAQAAQVARARAPRRGRRAQRLRAELDAQRRSRRRRRRRAMRAAARSCRRRPDAIRSISVRIVTADDIDRVLTYDALIDALAEAFRADIEVPRRHAHMIPQPSGSEAKLLLMPAWTNSGRAAGRLQDRQRLSRQRQARQAVGLRQLSADVRRHRRAAGADRRHRADRLAHRGGLRARRALSRARGRRASGHDRRRGACAASGPRPPRGAADQARHAVEPHALARDLDRLRAVAPPASSR